jgi:hypothetical protein
MLVPITEVADWRLTDDQFLAAFQLPHKGAGNLAVRYPFPREDRIVFDEGRHEYTIDEGMKAPRSVTGLLHEYTPAFNPQAALHAMRHGRAWEQKKAALEEKGVSTQGDGILRSWERNGEIARARGHLLHYQASHPAVDSVCMRGVAMQLRCVCRRTKGRTDGEWAVY